MRLIKAILSLALLAIAYSAFAQTDQGSQLRRTMPKPLEYYYGKTVAGKTWPWASVSEANANIPITRRYAGHAVIIGPDTSNYQLYWYAGGITDNKLVPFIALTNAGTSQLVPLLILNGESNSGGQALNSSLTAPQLAVRPRVQILHNRSFLFQPLDIGTNNNIDHYGLDSTLYHGWENGLAHSVEAGQWYDTTLYMVKTGQGGSTIAEWAANSTYTYKFNQRVYAAQRQLRAMGKIPVPYILFTLGINDRVASTDTATFHTAIVAHFNRMRATIGFAPIIIPHFMTTALADAYDTVLERISRELPFIYRIDVTGLPTDGGFHWTTVGMDSISRRIARLITDSIGQHEKYILTQTAKLSTLSTSISGITGGGFTTVYDTLEDKTFTSITGWTTFADGSNFAGIISGHLRINDISSGSPIAVAFKQGIYVPGNILRVTLTGVTIASGAPRIFFGNSGSTGDAVALTAGTNTINIVTRTGAGFDYIILDVPPTGDFTVDRIIVEKQSLVPSGSAVTVDTVKKIVHDSLKNIVHSSFARVDTAGNDASALPNREDLPFKTISAALDATASFQTREIRIGTGTFASPAQAKIKSNTYFYGSGRPSPNYTTTVTGWTTSTNTSPTKLVGGTILQGTLSIAYNVENITIENLGVDVGLDYCTANYGGTAQEGIIIGQDYNLGGGAGYGAADGVHRLQTTTNPRRGMRVHNVASICKSAASLVHAFAIENCVSPNVSGLYTYFGFAGIVIKCLGGTFTELHPNGHDIAGIFVKSNDYAHCYGNVISNFECRSIGSFDGGGVRIDANDAGSPGIGFLTISNGNCWGTKYAVMSAASTLGGLDNITIQNVSGIVLQGNGIDVAGINLNVQNCLIRAAGGDGIKVVSRTLEQSSVTGCSSEGNTGWGFNLTYCLYNGLRAQANTAGTVTGSNNTAF